MEFTIGPAVIELNNREIAIMLWLSESNGGALVLHVARKGGRGQVDALERRQTEEPV